MGAFSIIDWLAAATAIGVVAFFLALVGLTASVMTDGKRPRWFAAAVCSVVLLAAAGGVWLAGSAYCRISLCAAAHPAPDEEDPSQ